MGRETTDISNSRGWVGVVTVVGQESRLPTTQTQNAAGVIFQAYPVSETRPTCKLPVQEDVRDHRDGLE